MLLNHQKICPLVQLESKNVDLLKNQKHLFTEASPFKPRLLKTQQKSRLIDSKYYNAPLRKKDSIQLFNTTFIEGPKNQLLTNNGNHLFETELDEESNNSDNDDLAYDNRYSDHTKKWLNDQEKIEITNSDNNLLNHNNLSSKNVDNQHYSSKYMLNKISSIDDDFKYKKEESIHYIKSDPDEYLYMEFMKQITNDILDKGIFTNKVLTEVFEHHIELNKVKLKEDKMFDAITILRNDLGIPTLSEEIFSDQINFGFECIQKLSPALELFNDDYKINEKTNLKNKTKEQINLKKEISETKRLFSDDSISLKKNNSIFESLKKNSNLNFNKIIKKPYENLYLNTKECNSINLLISRNASSEINNHLAHDNKKRNIISSMASKKLSVNLNDANLSTTPDFQKNIKTSKKNHIKDFSPTNQMRLTEILSNHDNYDCINHNLTNRHKLNKNYEISEIGPMLNSTKDSQKTKEFPKEEKLVKNYSLMMKNKADMQNMENIIAKNLIKNNNLIKNKKLNILRNDLKTLNNQKLSSQKNKIASNNKDIIEKPKPKVFKLQEMALNYSKKNDNDEKNDKSNIYNNIPSNTSNINIDREIPFTTKINTDDSSMLNSIQIYTMSLKDIEDNDNKLSSSINFDAANLSMNYNDNTDNDENNNETNLSYNDKMSNNNTINNSFNATTKNNNVEKHASYKTPFDSNAHSVNNITNKNSSFDYDNIKIISNEPVESNTNLNITLNDNTDNDENENKLADNQLTDRQSAIEEAESYYESDEHSENSFDITDDD